MFNKSIAEQQFAIVFGTIEIEQLVASANWQLSRRPVHLLSRIRYGKVIRRILSVIE